MRRFEQDVEEFLGVLVVLSVIGIGWLGLSFLLGLSLGIIRRVSAWVM
jgi:hypothetical protein